MNPILVIGGGISGITSALELAEAGKEVIILEKTSHLGGNVVKMNSYFPKLCPPACGMEINFRRIKNNPRISVFTHSEVLSIEGQKGNFKVRIASSAQFVNDLCTSCGDCSEACPENRPDSFNFNHGLTPAIFLPQPQAYPQKLEIDANYCKGESCGKCVEVCDYDAIDLLAKDSEEILEIHSIIVATGWKHYNPSNLAGLNYHSSTDIVTNVEFERLLSKTGPGKGKLLRPSDKTAPASVAFVQCAGSRDRNYLPYCSAVCCSASLKHALNITELLPETKVSVFYIDLRVVGRNEDFLKRVESEENIKLIKGKIASIQVDEEARKLLVVAEDISKGKKISEHFDIVVLATGIVPENTMPGLKLNQEGFLAADQADGIFPAACAKKPMDVSASVKDATSAAVKAMKN